MQGREVLYYADCSERRFLIVERRRERGRAAALFPVEHAHMVHDERIADGVYFAKSVQLLRTLLANPELLELPIQTPVDLVKV